MVKRVLNDLINIHSNEQQLRNIIFLIFLVVLLRETIKYATTKKKREQKQERQLQDRIFHLEKLVSTNFNDMNLMELTNKKTELQILKNLRVDGVIIRSTCTYESLGEKL